MYSIDGNLFPDIEDVSNHRHFFVYLFLTYIDHQVQYEHMYVDDLHRYNL